MKKYYHDFFNDKFVREIVYPNKKKGYFVDCGATDGILQSQSLRLEQDGWRGLCIEPCLAYTNSLKNNRPLAKIDTSAIVPKKYEGERSFYENPQFTLSSVSLDSMDTKNWRKDHYESYKVNGLSIVSILNKNNAPKIIDFMGIDIEGSFTDTDITLEEEVIKELLDSEYKVNFFAVEHYWPPNLDKIFNDTPYFKIKNPFLDAMWLSTETGLSYTLSPNGHYVCQQYGNEEERDITDMKKIVWEAYYVHMDVIKENKKLKNFLT
tara:strand:+ start:950 stop:1744 length:795 start_codon:yes stop_codon:yes gene_type:complete